MLPLAQRNKLQRLINGDYDTVYVESLRALGRKATVIEDVYEMAKKSNTNIVVADMPGVFNPDATPTENFLRRVQAAVQEYERDIIVHRLQQGLQARKAALQRGNPKKRVKVNGRKSLMEKHPLAAGQERKLKLLCKQKLRGAFGWRPMAVKCGKIFKLPT